MLEPFDIVIFGGAGDLALRKLIPALYGAYKDGSFPEGSRVIAVCRFEEEIENYRELARDALQQHGAKDAFCPQQWRGFGESLLAVGLDIATPDQQWDYLSGLLAGAEDRARIFYMAIPPALYGTCCEHLSAKGLISDQSRLVVEKPIGYDADSARVINARIGEFFEEQSIFRIDHYLGKETVQNLMALRFTNVLFEQLWDAKTIDHVQISISETVGLEGRASFYDGAGAMRDMVQNHLLQLLCLIAMESPNKLTANSIRAEKLKVLEALRPLRDNDVRNNTVAGQYVAGELSGTLAPGYLEELGEPSSITETFVALRAHVDNWRWAQVPFYLRTGKRMKQRCAEVVIQYKDVSHRVFDKSAGPLSPNRLVIRLQPEESIQLTLMAKNLAQLEMELQPVTLNLNFADACDGFHSDAYKRLLLDVAANNPSLFIHRDEIESAWAWVDPIVDYWRESGNLPALYRAGSWGPDAAEELLSRDGRCWFNAGHGLDSEKTMSEGQP